jgi:hypothetical protein
MSELKKYKLIEFLIAFGYLGILVIIMLLMKKELLDDNIGGFMFIILTIIFSIIAYSIDKKLKKLNKEERECEAQKENEEMKKKLFERSSVNNIVNMMYELYSGNSNELNEVLTRYDLMMEYIYDDERNEDWFYIENREFPKKKNQFYVFELSGEGKVTLEKHEHLDVSNMSYNELVEYIVNDIKTFFNEEE